MTPYEPPVAEGMVALLFTDLVSSTELLDRVGDDAAERLRRTHFALLREAVNASRGREVKNLGDGLMVVFSSALDAVACAVAMQQAVERHNRVPDSSRLNVRVGLHAGEPIRDEDDFFGSAVVVAKRLCDAAGGGLVLASELIRGLVGSRGQQRFTPVGRLSLKGFSERLGAFEVAWTGENTAAERPTPRTPRGGGVLRTRLLPPRPPPGALDRPALREQLQAGLRGRLAIVTAGAGYGKSTLLAQTLAEIDTTWVWLSCDERLGSVGAFLAHLAEGLRQRFPGVAAHMSLEGSVEDQVAELCNEVVETISDEFVVALDDVHLLLGLPAMAAVGRLLSDLPPNAHLALTSRVGLPFALGRMRADGMLELGEESLALSQEESATLLRAASADVRPEAVRELHRRTEGWVTGLLLAAQSGGVVRDPSALAAAGPHFDYLAEEVIERLPPETQAFLLDTAVLERFSPELAEAVSGRPEARELIDALVARRLFTIRLETDGEWYRYHHLFQAFLRRRGLDRPDRVWELHHRAAGWWIGAGEVSEGVRHLMEAGDHAGAVEALEPVVEAMVSTPEAEMLAGWLDAIPEHLWAHRPSLILAHAAVLLTRARHEASFAAFERAIDRLLEAGDDERAAAAWVRLQQSMVTAGTRPARRIQAGRRYAERISPTARLFPFGRIFLATAYAYGGRFREAREELDAALGEPAAAASPLLGPYAGIAQNYYIAFWLGPPEDALAAFDGAVDALRQHESEDLLGFMPYADMLRLYLLNALGRYEDALVEAARTEEAFDRRGIGRAPARVMPWVRSLALAGLGRWEELAGVMEVPPQAADPGDATSYTYRYRVPAVRLAAHRGDIPTVRAQIAAARKEIAAFGDAFDHSLFLCEMSQAAWQVGAADLAASVAQEALTSAEAIGAPWPLALACLTGALVEGATEQGDRLLSRALDLTDKHSLGYLWTRRERFVAGRLLLAALERDLGAAGLVERLLAESGGAVFAEVLAAASDPGVRTRLAGLAGSVADVDIGLIDGLLRDRSPKVRESARRSWAKLTMRPRASIRLVTFGRLQALREGVPIPDAAFTRQKARALLAALVAVGGPVHREMLAEWLWPELPAKRAAAALRTTLHDLRRALEPEFEPGSPSSLIASEGDTVRLALGEGRDSWDGADLLALARRSPEDDPAAEIERLQAAESLYAGPFLQEWPYEDWSVARRDELEHAHRDILGRLAEALVGVGQPRAAVPRLRRLVALEPERESWHRALMLAHVAAGDRALALRQYHACRATLRREQGIEPGPDTRALYQRLLMEEVDGTPDDARAVTSV